MRKVSDKPKKSKTKNKQEDSAGAEDRKVPTLSMELYMHSLQNPILDEFNLLKQIDGSEEVAPEPVKQSPAVEAQPLKEETTEQDDHNKPKSIGVQSLRNRLIPIILLIQFFFLGNLGLGAVISDSLRETMSNQDSEDGMFPVVVILKNQYDTQKLYNQVKDLSLTQRRMQVVQELKHFSQTEQRGLILKLDNLKSQNRVRKVKPLWMANAIGMEASNSVILELSKDTSIARIVHDPMRKLWEDELQIHLPSAGVKRGSKDPDMREIAQHLSLINAPQVWAQGFQGEDVVVAVIDSGVNWAHPDLLGRFWEHPDYINYGYNFLDDNIYTEDSVGHGTFCAGIIAGTGASGTMTGVAPESKIMILKIANATGHSTQMAVWQSIQFAVEYGADVINLSLGWQYSWNPDRVTWRNLMTNTMIAGVSSAVAIGNEGSTSLRTPGDCPPPWLNPDQTLTGGLSGAVSVGATNYQDEVASFSSRGPATWGSIAPFNDYPLNPEMGLLRPDLCAPGVDIVSTNAAATETYTSSSGTSFATPTVAGVMALMYSKKRSLTPEDISRILEESSIPLAPIKNNHSGSGRLDALEAVNAAGAFVDILQYYVLGTENNQIVPGQSALLDVSLINYGNESVSEVVATLSCDDAYATIENAEVYFGTVPAGGSQSSAQMFGLSIAENIPHGYSLELTLSFVAARDIFWEHKIHLNAIAPQLRILRPLVQDPLPGGNGNGVIEAGEHLQLVLPISNTGGLPSSAALFTLEGGEGFELHSVSTTGLPPVEAGGTVYPHAVITIDGDAQIGQELRLNYSLDAYPYLFTGEAITTVGSVINVQIGSGNEVNSPSAAAPINIQYRSLRGQMVITAAELYRGGMIHHDGGLIRKLGFFVESSPLYPLPDFTIRMKHTTQENVADHDDGPFHTALVMDSYGPAAGGWDMLELETPFAWNGIDNILIDTAFSRAQTYNSSGQLRIEYRPDSYRYVRADNADQTSEVTTSVSANKPQITFGISETLVFSGASNLVAVNDGTSIDLSWDAPGSTGIEGYNLYRNGIQIASIDADATQWSDHNITHSTLYYYFVKTLIAGVETLPSNIVEITSNDPVAMPLILPENTIQSTPYIVSISCATPGATIRYTLDGATPGHDSPIYAGSFELSGFHTTVKAIASVANSFDSEIATRDYYLLPVPQNLVLVPSPGLAELSWDPAQRVSPGKKAEQRNEDTLLGYNVYRAYNACEYEKQNPSPINANIFSDANLPSGEYQYYVTSVFGAGESHASQIVSADIIGYLPMVQFTPPAGSYEQEIQVKLVSTIPSSRIFYTTDGTDPHSGSTQYNGSALSLLESTTIKAYSGADGWLDSPISSGEYIITDSANEDHNQVPASTGIKACFPNPFNPDVTIQYTLSKPNSVQLDVFSVKGQLVKRLLDTQQNAGEFRITWDGRDASGNVSSSGIYFIRLRTRDAVSTRKVMMLK